MTGDARRVLPGTIAQRGLERLPGRGVHLARGLGRERVGDDLEAFVRRLKAEVDGVIAVAGPDLAASVGELGLIDEYQLYLRPFVLGRGKPYFAAVPKPLRLVDTTAVGEDALRLTFVPA